ncbi:hypothetical protein DWY45_05925 [Phocaeicola plebeius]|uniref:Uncharacterized protein n=4 Tax=Bacteroidaceae TaxID=815 RepID=A0A3E5EQU1_BACUN|nr:hypothetical protein DXD33_02275 [Phocaeicola vulgatus]RGN91329.1 hypothetical protein DXB37_16665 [Bacteroides uniformis]RGR55412.1 hypothetical protein DWY45_05925 [Phocaeicola plebeius]RGU01350.1 hypothetical protein DWX01_06170 [Bacteroides eggerthii]RGU58815.1 hypothetical protein DWW55_18020 [Paraprevotella clara]
MEKNPPAFAGQVGFGMPEKFRAAENTTCSVRLNRESSFVGLQRDVHGTLWSDEVSSFPSSDSDFAKLDSDNRLVNSV